MLKPNSSKLTMGNVRSRAIAKGLEYRPLGTCYASRHTLFVNILVFPVLVRLLRVGGPGAMDPNFYHSCRSFWNG